MNNSNYNFCIYLIVRLVLSFTITVPDSKEDIFIKMMKSINFIKKIQEVSDPIISEEHKEIVRTRIKNMKEHPESCLTWEDIKKKIKL